MTVLNGLYTRDQKQLCKLGPVTDSASKDNAFVINIKKNVKSKTR